MKELNVAREQDNAGEVDASPVVESHPPPSACSPRPVHTDLMLAAQQGDSLKMMTLLRANAEIDEETAEEGWNALFYACFRCNHSCIQMLLAARASVDHADKRGWTPLMHAVEDVDFCCVTTLLAAKANVNHASKNGCTALMEAVLEDNFDNDSNIVQALLGANADVDAADCKGETALMISAYCDTGKVCQALIDAGASVNQADEDGLTALMIACKEDNESCAKILLSANADAYQTDHYRNDAMDHARHNSKYLPMFYSIDCIRLLLKPRVQLLWRTVRRAVAKHFMAWYLYQALWVRSNGVEKDLRRLDRMLCETRMTMMVEDDHDVTPQQHKRKRACYNLLK